MNYGPLESLLADSECKCKATRVGPISSKQIAPEELRKDSIEITCMSVVMDKKGHTEFEPLSKPKETPSYVRDQQDGANISTEPGGVTTREWYRLSEHVGH